MLPIHLPSVRIFVSLPLLAALPVGPVLHGAQIPNPVVLLNGQTYTATSSFLVIDGNLLVSGINPDGTRSNYQFPDTLSFGGDASTRQVTIADGGILGGGRLFLGKLANPTGDINVEVRGVNSNGTSSEINVSGLFLNIPGPPQGLATLSILDGGLLTAGLIGGDEQQPGTNIIVSGVNGNGTRSTLKSGNYAAAANLEISDGGFADLGEFTSFGNSLATISGVDQNGNRSTLQTSTLSVFGARIITKNGALIEATNLNLYYSDAETRETGDDGTRSVIHVSETLTLASSSLLIADGARVTADLVHFSENESSVISVSGGDRPGILETGGISGLGGTSAVELDGGILRITRNGDPFENWNSSTLRMLGSGGTIDTGERSITLGTNIEGPGGLAKTGTGTLELTGSSIYSGGTVVREGILLVNNQSGSATGAGPVTVLSGARIGGSGSIAGSLVNEGVVSPGNSPGTLSIGGGYKQNSTGTLVMEFASADQHDVLKVGGKVRLAGTLQLQSIIPLEFGQQFKIIEAEGAVTGEFDSIIVKDTTGTRATFIAEGGSGQITVAPETYAQLANTPNETSIANALDTWISETSGDALTVSGVLDTLSPTEYKSAFASISPSLHEAARSMAVEQSQGQLRLLGQHLDSRRLLANTSTEKPWDVWGIGSGQYSSGSMTPVDGDRLVSDGFLTGADLDVGAGTSVGFFTGYNHGQADFAGSNEIEQNTLVAGGYATFERNGFHASSVLGAGVIDSDVVRSIRFGALSRTARSSTDGSEFFSSISGGYDFRQGNWTFGPTAGIQYSRASFNHFRESGAGALDLHMDDTSQDSLRGMLGGRATYLIKVSDTLTLAPEARLFWQHEFLRGTDTLHGNLSGGTSPDFSYQTADADGDSVITGIGLGFKTAHDISGNLSYDIEFGRGGDTNHTLSLGVDWKF